MLVSQAPFPHLTPRAPELGLILSPELGLMWTRMVAAQETESHRQNLLREVKKDSTGLDLNTKKSKLSSG